ncbi:MAG: HAD family hydrolase, partial [Acidimicrobiia bacterium]
MSDIDIAFFDVGGVLLTNGWDSDRRRKACAAYDLDWAEFEDRHQFVADAFETGQLGLAVYLERTVFYRPRDFSPDDFADTMRASSSALPGGLELIRELAATGLTLATINNESRMLNDHRIHTFGLDEIFQAFFSSCFLGVRKPDEAIYRMAFTVMAREPHRCVFVDDRAVNAEGARATGMRTIHHVDPPSTRAA